MRWTNCPSPATRTTTIDAEVVIPKLHPAQLEIYENARRFNVVVCGRRYGKTKLGLYRAYRTMKRGGTVGWFAPTYRILMDAWREATRRLAPAIPARGKSEQEKRFQLGNGGTFEAWSMVSGDAGRSRKYDQVFLDEAAMIPNLKDEFEASIRPTLSESRGGGWLLSTPKGYDDFQVMWEKGQAGGSEKWASWQEPTLRNPIISAAELDEVKGEIDPKIFAQEYEASFEYFAGRVYINFDRRYNVDEDVKDPGGEVLIGMDFNVDPMSAVVWSKVAGEPHVWDAISIQDSNTEQMADEIKRRYPGRSVTVYPDASGKSRKTSAPVGQTDLAILRRAGFTVRAPSANPAVVDRINVVNAVCLNAKGVRRLKIKPMRATMPLIKALEQLSYKDGTCVVDKTKGHDHMADALGYPMCVEYPIRAGGDRIEFGWG